MGKRDEKRRIIEEGAIDIILNEGILNLSVENLASRLGMSKSAIYYYFETKDEIVVNILRQAWEDMTKFLESISTKPLEEVIEEHIKYAERNRRRIKVMFMLTQAIKDRKVEKLVRREVEIYKRIIEREIEQGNLKGDVNHIYQAIAGSVKEVVRKDIPLNEKVRLALETIRKFK